MCDKAVDKCFLTFIYCSDRCKTQEMCDRVISEDLFMLVYCPEKYITQMIDDCLAAFKFICD